jgi:mannose-6-phosphate isomerase-like protein (cupin superfamily)
MANLAIHADMISRGERLTAFSTAGSHALALEPGEGQAIWFLGNRMTIKATAQSTGGLYGLVESWLAPGFSPQLHIHRREDESFWVLEGELTMRCGDETFRVRPGSYILLPRDLPHTFVVEGDAPARLLTLMTPGGAEGFFVEAGQPAVGDRPAPAAPLDVELLTRVAEKFGVEIVGPPMTPTRPRRVTHQPNEERHT